jgi:peptidase inhibitor I78 family protein
MRKSILLLTVLAACTVAPGADPVVPAGDAATADPAADPVLDSGSDSTVGPLVDKTLADCGADEVLDVIGGSVIAAGDRLPADKRVIAPGSLVAQDYVPKRMNVFLNQRGVITKLSCG